ncbi:hypothetical protein NQ318_005891 [Aromia moschata]|uniref:Uncharacterized protein n=1 Tax=Aromia moschata TaxID=1265417 RepID=A0AAV8YSC5_9CUCU|nr:hypothetical protein NQ318_005891 [Aromia moschata]
MNQHIYASREDAERTRKHAVGTLSRRRPRRAAGSHPRPWAGLSHEREERDAHGHVWPPRCRPLQALSLSALCRRQTRGHTTHLCINGGERTQAGICETSERVRAEESSERAREKSTARRDHPSVFSTAEDQQVAGNNYGRYLLNPASTRDARGCTSVPWERAESRISCDALPHSCRADAGSGESGGRCLITPSQLLPVGHERSACFPVPLRVSVVFKAVTQ